MLALSPFHEKFNESVIVNPGGFTAVVLFLGLRTIRIASMHINNNKKNKVNIKYLSAYPVPSRQ